MFDLVAPVERVTGYDTHIPLFRLEMKYLPSVEKIVAAAKRTLAVELSRWSRHMATTKTFHPARPRRRPARRRQSSNGIVKVGDIIRLDEPLVSMETAKAVVEVPSPFSGKVLRAARAARAT